MLLSMAVRIVGGRCKSFLSGRGRGGHPRTSVLGSRGLRHRYVAIVGLDSSPLGPGLDLPQLGWVGLDVQFHSLSLGWIGRKWAVRVIVGVSVPSLGCTFRRRALSVDVGRYVSLTGGVCCR